MLKHVAQQDNHVRDHFKPVIKCHHPDEDIKVMSFSTVKPRKRVAGVRTDVLLNQFAKNSPQLFLPHFKLNFGFSVVEIVMTKFRKYKFVN